MKVFGLFAVILLGLTSVGQAQDIVQTAIAAGFDKLVAAILRSGLTSFLQHTGPNDQITVFAPTNEAFESLPEATLDFLFSAEGKSTLKDVLLYHVLGAPVFAADLSNGLTATTLLGEDITVTINDDGIFINDSEVIQADVEASNGVIHIIDQVLIPPSGVSVPEPEEPLPNIVETAVAAGFDTLVAAVTFAELGDALAAPEPLKTVFAPTNDAFAALPEETLAFLLTEEGKPTLVDILLYHVVGAQVLAADLSDGQVVETLLGKTVVITIGDVIKVNDSVVTTTDVLTSNGVIHIIDAVLIPPEDEPEEPLPNIVETAVAAGFDTLVAAVTFAELGDALAAPEPLKTVFAPTNDAFAALPEETLAFLLTEEGKPTLVDILLYHVVGAQVLAADLSDGQVVETLLGKTVVITIGDVIKVNDSVVTATDILTSNGVIHVIDAVLIPPADEPEEPELNIVDTAVAAGFNTLVAAVTFAELGEALAAPEPLKTVFAPTDSAFAALPQGTLGFLLTEEGKPALVDILLYHVVGAQVLAGDLTDGQVVETLLGKSVVITIGDVIKVNDSVVTATDVLTSNGVIHVIDAVLIPPEDEPEEPELNIVETAVAAGFDTLVAAVTFAELGEALAAPEPLKTVFAPTNDAFAALPEETLAFLLTEEGKPALTDILLYHVVGAQVLAADLSDGQVVETLLGKTVVISIGDVIKVNDSVVTATDILTTNGVIHVIDAVLIPPEDEPVEPELNIVEQAVAAGFDTLVAAVTFAELGDALAAPEPPKTVFAPTDEAFAALGEEALSALLTEAGKPVLTDVLLYHVVAAKILSTDLSDGVIATTFLGQDVTFTFSDDKIFVNDSEIIAVDIEVTNGVIHVIDAVLIPEGFALPQDIPGTAVAAGGFTTLVAALSATDLVGAVSAPNGPFTVFAPTDDAFAALPFGVVPGLLKEDGLPVLSDILLYHVVSGVALSTDLSDGQEIETLQGDDVVVSIDGEDLFINDSKVVAADILVTNGVIHAIDAVLLFDGVEVPVPTANIVETAVAAGFETLAAAVTFAELIDPLVADEPKLTVFAPTDDAFAALPSDLLEFYLTETGKGTLTDILLYHVVGSPIFAADITDGAIVTTLLGEDVVASVSEDGIKINDSNVIVADVITTNGVVHAIDAVLLQPSLFESVAGEGFSSLAAALKATGLDAAIGFPNGPFTIFAPNDEAFAKLPPTVLTGLLAEGGQDVLTDILLYHVASGIFLLEDLEEEEEIETLFGEDVEFSSRRDENKINDSIILVADVAAQNAVLHVIDSVLLFDGVEDLLPPVVEEDIVETAIAAEFGTLAVAVTNAGLIEALQAEEPLKTVFAPADAAFAALPQDLLAFYLTEEGLDILTSILLYHVVPEQILSFSLEDGDTVTTLEGTDLTVSVDGDAIKINDSNVLVKDVVTSNGVIHVIDAVLLQESLFTGDIPGTATGTYVFTTLVAALTATDLAGAVAFPSGPFTVFAPTDDAFAALPFGVVANLLKEDGLPVLSDILLYHVVSGAAFSTDLSDGQDIETLQGEDVTVSIDGDDLFINDSQVITADIVASNGVVHVIDAVLLFDGVEIPFPAGDIVSTAVEAGLDTLAAAVTFAELVEALQLAEPIKTVFAPTNDAFAALGDELLGFLLTEEGKGPLTDVLLYHVVGTPIFAADLVDGATVPTLLGGEVTVSIGDEIKINDSVVVAADVVTTNGVVHVIDAVLIPPGFEIPDL